MSATCTGGPPGCREINAKFQMAQHSAGGGEIVPALFVTGHTGQTCPLRRVRQGMRRDGIRHDELKTA